MPRVTHFDIHASEPAKLAAYCRELFGWKLRHLPHINPHHPAILCTMLEQCGDAAPRTENGNLATHGNLALHFKFL